MPQPADAAPSRTQANVDNTDVQSVSAKSDNRTVIKQRTRGSIPLRRCVLRRSLLCWRGRSRCFAIACRCALLETEHAEAPTELSACNCVVFVMHGFDRISSDWFMGVGITEVFRPYSFSDGQPAYSAPQFLTFDYRTVRLSATAVESLHYTLWIPALILFWMTALGLCPADMSCASGCRRVSMRASC